MENNQYAQSTPLSLNFSGSFSARAEAFGLETGEIESNDVEILYEHFEAIVKQIRENGKQQVQIVHTYRLGPHSKGDDDRAQEEIDVWRCKDPLKIAEQHLGKQEIECAERRVTAQLADAETKTRKMSFPTLNELR